VIAEKKILEMPSLAITCKRCGMNAGRVVEGTLIYTVKHGGEHHAIRIDLTMLQKILLASALTVLK
jgi:hypothetical protein